MGLVFVDLRESEGGSQCGTVHDLANITSATSLNLELEGAGLKNLAATVVDLRGGSGGRGGRHFVE